MLAKFIAQYEQETEGTVAKFVFVGSAQTMCDITRTINNERAAKDRVQCLDIARKVSCVKRRRRGHSQRRSVCAEQHEHSLTAQITVRAANGTERINGKSALTRLCLECLRAVFAIYDPRVVGSSQ